MNIEVLPIPTSSPRWILLCRVSLDTILARRPCLDRSTQFPGFVAVSFKMKGRYEEELLRRRRTYRGLFSYSYEFLVSIEVPWQIRASSIDFD